LLVRLDAARAELFGNQRQFGADDIVAGSGFSAKTPVVISSPRVKTAPALSLSLVTLCWVIKPELTKPPLHCHCRLENIMSVISEHLFTP